MIAVALLVGTGFAVAVAPSPASAEVARGYLLARPLWSDGG
jgi:hypothetical protein